MREIQIHKLIRSRRKSIALMVSPDATLVVRAPLGVSLDYIHDLVRQKRAWIETKLGEALKHGPAQKKNFIDGEDFLFLGEKQIFKIYDGSEIKLDSGTLLFPRQFLQKAETKLIYWYKEKAIEVIAEIARHYSEISGWKFKTINITSAKGRWGSCSSTGSINFTWKLAMAPLEIIDYVVVHELAHITEKNHSSRFWNKVQTLLPDYKKRRKWLKDYGRTLSF